MHPNLMSPCGLALGAFALDRDAVAECIHAVLRVAVAL